MYKTLQHLWIGRRGALSISRRKNSRFLKSCVSSNWEDLQKGCGCCSLSQSPNWWLEEPYLCWWPPQHPSVPLATKALPGGTPVRQRRCHPWMEATKATHQQWPTKTSAGSVSTIASRTTQMPSGPLDISNPKVNTLSAFKFSNICDLCLFVEIQQLKSLCESAFIRAFEHSVFDVI